MPTVLRKEGFSFRIYLDDHNPAHVHVFKAEGEVKIQIGDDFADCRLISVYGMNRKDAKRALEIAIAHRMELLNGWRKIHE
jgi:hypothetical protein